MEARSAGPYGGSKAANSSVLVIQRPIALLGLQRELQTARGSARRARTAEARLHTFLSAST